MLADFLTALFKLYVDLNFVYMEINPIVVVDGRITPLDMAAKIDETASFLCGQKWGDIDFPAPFGEDIVFASLLASVLPSVLVSPLSRFGSPSKRHGSTLSRVLCKPADRIRPFSTPSDFP